MKSPYHPKGIATKARKLCWRSQRPTLRTGNIQNSEMGIHSQLVRLMLHKQVDVAVEFRFDTTPPNATGHRSLFERVWPIGAIVFAALVTVAWGCALGYGIFLLGTWIF